MILGLVIGTCTAKISAQEDFGDEKYSLGYQGALYYSGLSFKKSINEKAAVQGIVEPVGIVKVFAARYLMTLRTSEKWKSYGYGVGGVRMISFAGYSSSAPSFGAGAGFEYDFRAIAPDLPPLYISLELGFEMSPTDAELYNYSGISFGVGVHYAFH